jgi:hypothetical protein
MARDREGVVQKLYTKAIKYETLLTSTFLVQMIIVGTI